MSVDRDVFAQQTGTNEGPTTTGAIADEQAIAQERIKQEKLIAKERIKQEKRIAKEKANAESKLAGRESIESQENVSKLIDSMLTRKQAKTINDKANFTNAINELEIGLISAGKTQSEDSKKLVDEIKALYGDVTKNDISQFDLVSINKRMKDIQMVVKESGNILGIEMEHMENLVDLTKKQIKDKQGSLLITRAIRDSAQYAMQNSIDISSIVAGLTTNSPIMMFATKMIGDFGKNLWDKRKEIREERQKRLAEQLETHQQQAHDDRIKIVETLNKRVENITNQKEGKQPLSDTSSKTDIEIVRPIINDQSPVLDGTYGSSIDIEPIVEEQKRTNSILDGYIGFLFRRSVHDDRIKIVETLNKRVENITNQKEGKQPLSDTSSKTDIEIVRPIINDQSPVLDGTYGSSIDIEMVRPIANDQSSLSEGGTSTNINIEPIVDEQKRTNSILDGYIGFLFRRSAHDEEKETEKTHRDEKILAAIQDQNSGSGTTPEKKGFFGKLIDFIMAIPGIKMLVKGVGIAGITAFFTTTLPAAMTGIITFLTGTLLPGITSFFGMLASVAAPIMAGITLLVVAKEAVMSVFNAGEKLGREAVDTSDRIAAGIGGIMEGFGKVADWIAGLLGFDQIYEEWWNKSFTRPLADFFNNFSMDNIIHGAKEGFYAVVNQAIEKFDFRDLIFGYMDEIYAMFDGIFNISDKIDAILSPMDITGKVESIKKSILDFIPDFLLSDEQKAKKIGGTPTATSPVNPGVISTPQEERRLRLVTKNNPGVSVERIRSESDTNPPQLRLVQKAERLPSMSSHENVQNEAYTHISAVGDQISTSSNKVSTESNVAGNMNESNNRFETLMRPVDSLQQPGIVRAMDRTNNIKTFDQIIKENDSKQSSIVMPPTVNNNQQITNKTSYSVPAMPYNQERGVRDLQRTFAA